MIFIWIAGALMLGLFVAAAALDPFRKARDLELDRDWAGEPGPDDTPLQLYTRTPPPGSDLIDERPSQL